jgi:hypothetical protein
VDELALQFQGTKDKKLLAQIAALNRSDPKNRHAPSEC